jgi:hypothetical protein
MRLKQYLNEGFTPTDKQLKESIGHLDGKIGTKIKSQCKPFLSQIKSLNLPGIFRGHRHLNHLISVKKVRKDRRSLDTDQMDSDAIDDWFENKFGWRPRAQALMTSGRPGQAGGYGDLFLVIPVGNFKILWSRTVDDLYVKQDTMKHSYNLLTWNQMGDEDSPANIARRKGLDQLLGYDYEETDKLSKQMIFGVSAGELMVKCDKYWAIDYRTAMTYVAEREELDAFELIDRHKNNRDTYKLFYKYWLGK